MIISFTNCLNHIGRKDLFLLKHIENQCHKANEFYFFKHIQGRQTCVDKIAFLGLHVHDFCCEILSLALLLKMFLEIGITSLAIDSNDS